MLSEEYAIEEEGSGVALERADYFEWRYFDNVMNNNNNDNINEYIDLIYQSDGLPYAYMKSTIPIVCNGGESCFFTNIVINIDHDSISVRFRTVHWYWYSGQTAASELCHQFSSDKKCNDRSEALCTSFDFVISDNG